MAITEILTEASTRVVGYHFYYVMSAGCIAVYHETPECCMENLGVFGLPNVLKAITEHACGEESFGWTHMSRKKKQ